VSIGAIVGAVERRRPTLADVARVAGVSRATASRALNGRYGSSAETQEHVRGVAERLGFTPHTVAQALATGSSPTSSRARIEVLIVDADPAALSEKPFYGRVLTGALRALGQSGSSDISLDVRRVDAVPRHDPDGEPPFGRVLINVPTALDGSGAPGAAGCRTVSLGRSAAGVAFVAPDNEDGGFQAARHLAAVGRTRIGAVFGPATPCALERKAGFLRGADGPVMSVDGDFTRQTAYVATLSLLARHPGLDAIFAACDVTAMGVLRALREAGRRVPSDVALVGFDGSALAEAADLTSVYMPVEDEAASAVQHLLNPGLPWPGRLPTTLKVRGSSAA
jgi:DNA-binding LacI/PurR family transcriptional regulator